MKKEIISTWTELTLTREVEVSYILHDHHHPAPDDPGHRPWIEITAVEFAVDGYATETYAPTDFTDKELDALRDQIRDEHSDWWWDEMVADIVETPDMCAPDDSPQQVLGYAKDVVSEYIRKRFPLSAE